jgi:putative cell wall-binding protein
MRHDVHIVDLGEIGDLLQLADAADVRRIGGSDRFATAGLIADEVGGTEAFVAQGFDPDPRRGWPDALAASSLAAYQGRAILLVTTDSLPPATADAIDRLDITDVTIAGGAAAVNADVEQALRDRGATVARVSGATRYDTAAALAELAVGAGETVQRTWVASGENFPDALVTGPAAAKDGGVLILVHPADLASSGATRDFLAARADAIDEVVLLGGESAISANVEQQIAALIE